MNKATFKALREHAGISHAALADALGVSERSVKRWEEPRYPDPPDDACRIVRDARERQLEMADYALEMAEAAGAPCVRMNYYRTQAEYDVCGRDAGDFRQANANARAAADALETMGYEVEYFYPVDDGWTETPPNPL